MKHLTTAFSVIALFLGGVLAESIIARCDSEESTQRAKELIAAAGGNVFYEYRHIGGFAAVVNLELIEKESLFKTNCSYVLDQVIPAPRPVRVDG